MSDFISPKELLQKELKHLISVENNSLFPDRVERAGILIPVYNEAIEAIANETVEPTASDIWDENKVIDFVNWYIRLHNLGINYELENRTIIRQFKIESEMKQPTEQPCTLHSVVCCPLCKATELTVRPDESFSCNKCGIVFVG